MSKTGKRLIAAAKEAIEIARVGACPIDTKRCFMDGIDWQYHLEGDMRGTMVFPDEGDVRREKKCIADGGGCGIVEVEVRLIRWVEPQDLSKG